jgi:beta-galactosidase
MPQVVSVRNGRWRFTWRDDAGYSEPGFNDTAWASVSVPGDWRTYPGYDDASLGWFRRNFSLSPTQQAAAARGELCVT